MGDANPSSNSTWRNGNSRWNGTRSGGGDDSYRNRPGWWNSDRDGNSVYADSIVTYVIATCYLSFLCFVALIMCFKNMTRLRVIAAFATFAGLTIAVVGYLRANNTVLPNIYWAWNFLAESLGVIALAIAIVSVGSGFYPMTGGRSIYARMSFVVIFLYAIVSLGVAIFYFQQRVLKHFIPPDQVKQLRIDIVKTDVLTQMRLDKIINSDITAGRIPNNTDIYGAASYDQLSMPEQTFYMRPSPGFYLGHQVFMLLTCVWVCMYLFIPLVRNHRHGPAGRSVDSDMMAIGVWYLTCLMSLATAYAILNLVYVFKNELIYMPQIQALDLCLRITIGPIYFLPAPKMLIRFYRNHFKKFRSSSANKTSSGDRWKSRWRKGGSRGNGGDGSGSGSSNTDSRTRHDSSNQIGSGSGSGGGGQNQHALSRLDRGSGGGIDDVIAACDSFDVGTGNHYRYNGNGKGSDTRITMPATTSPPPPTHKGLKLARSRDRGLSVESSRVLVRDLECNSSLFYQSDQETVGNRPDSFYNADYYGSGGMIMLDHRKDLTLDSLSPGPGPSPMGGFSSAGGHRHHTSNSSNSSGASGNGAESRERKSTYGFDHPKPPKLALSPQQQQFLQSAPRSKLNRTDSADSPVRMDFPSRSPIS
ncbi:hypothetical protein EC957_003141 [Mortierella hygrophila]|uniref:Uncharacterized protein n=1 Tax=Mortierella hygrophila TaxID=979708 RepID=A0A9P6F3Z5_9FUNG|nr:hypothetical protein EC957_003141 [Mortierella hygrophila]